MHGVQFGHASITVTNFTTPKPDLEASAATFTRFDPGFSIHFVGKLSIYDLIRSLVPESAKKTEFSRMYYRTLSSRALEVADEVGAVQERFKWLHSTFLDLVKQETQKKVKEVMSPIHPVLVEDDGINKAIYLMFKENIRQPMVTRDGKIIGVVSIMDIFPELLEIAGDVCVIG
jgi:CBS-domain-containing membrane protein